MSQDLLEDIYHLTSIIPMTAYPAVIVDVRSESMAAIVNRHKPVMALQCRFTFFTRTTTWLEVATSPHVLTRAGCTVAIYLHCTLADPVALYTPPGLGGMDPHMGVYRPSLTYPMISRVFMHVFVQQHRPQVPSDTMEFVPCPRDDGAYLPDPSSSAHGSKTGHSPRKS
eukprot:scaffold1440_cov332-Pavlova_lutheri.AAC.12